MVGRNGLRTVFLIVLMTGVLLIIGQLLGGVFGLAIAAVFAVGMNFFSYWYSDKLILKTMHAREVSEPEAPELHRIVERAAREAKLPKPKVYIVDTPAPNAFATGRNPDHAVVAATTGIMSLLTERELAGVFAHELGHVRNRDILINSIVAMMASTIMIIAMFARWSLFFGMMFGMGGRGGRGSDQMAQLAGTLVLAIVAPIVAGIIQMAVSRSREYGADEIGARNSRDPEALASALTKLQMATQHPRVQAAAKAMAGMEAANHLFIVNPLAGGVGKWFVSHPPVEDRVARLRAIGRDIGQIF
ncbi:MAG: zinc metalloprotease HtpX [Dehalococcoidia bacterium]